MSLSLNFLDYARPFRGTFAPVSILVALQKTVQLLKHDFEDSVELSLECDDQLPDINGDAEQLRQVFINLILNAADAIKRSGNIEIVCRGTDYAGKRFGYDPDDLTHIEIRISDNGPGIEPHLKDKVFIPFYTTKTKGTGLGLALCKRIVIHHGGSIHVESRKEEGTTFVIRLPSLKANLRLIGTPKEKVDLSDPS